MLKFCSRRYHSVEKCPVGQTFPEEGDFNARPGTLSCSSNNVKCKITFLDSIEPNLTEPIVK